MNYAVTTLLFVVSLALASRRGIGFVFAYVYLPVLLLFSNLKPVALPGVPDMTTLFAVVIGGCLGAIIGGKVPVIRFHWIDGLVGLLSLSILCTNYMTDHVWTVVSSASVEVLRVLLPYAMARAAFREPLLRRHMAISCAFVGMIYGGLGLIEFRLWPNITSRTLANLGLNSVPNIAVLGRYGFFRAMVTADHPIDYGNVSFMLGAVIVAMAVSGGVSLRDRRIVAGVLGCLASVLLSMSFSSIAGLGVTLAIFLLLRYVRNSEWLLVPGVIAAIVAAFLVTARLLTYDLSTMPAPSATDTAVDGSLYVRTVIVQNSWNRVAQYAGYFGFGEQNITKDDLGLDSVDNSYMLFLIRRGWVHLWLRLFLCVAIAGIGTAMLRDARGNSARTPPAMLVAGLLGTCAAMYTVWFGFVYAELWTAVLGIAVTMRQIVADRRAAAADALPTTFAPSLGGRRLTSQPFAAKLAGGRSSR